MPAPLGRGTCSPRRIIDPYAWHYLAVPPACFAFLVWRFCLRVFVAAFFLLLLPPLSFVAMWRLPSSSPLDSSDSGPTRRLWQETSTPAECLGCGTWRSPDHCEQAPALASYTLRDWRPGLPLHDRVHRGPQRVSQCSVCSMERSDGRRSTTLLPGAPGACVRRLGLPGSGSAARCSLRSE
jgi:hypothetical protein